MASTGVRAIRKEGAHWPFMRSKRILYAVKNKTSVEGAGLYVTFPHALPVPALFYSMGIKKVMYLNSVCRIQGISQR